jgi:hypothetical protein
MRRFRAVALLIVCAFVACAEPPTKEMNQAQGAIDAARSAGAEQFGAGELAAAIDALRKSEEAAGARDYRLALNHAIESRDRAQNAAKMAVNARARARGDVEALVAEATTLLTHARDRLRQPDVARLPRRTLQNARVAIEAAQTSVQNARTALDKDDYAAARKAVDGAAARIQRAISSIEDAADGNPSRRRR